MDGSSKTCIRPRARGRQLARHLWGRLGADGGFSMIEIMVVSMIIGVLLAVAVPTYLGGRAGSRDRAAQTDLRTALTSVESYRVEHGAYSADLTTLAGHDPSLPWTAGDAVAGISITLPPLGDAGRAVCLSRMGASGILAVTRVTEGETTGTYYGSGECPDDAGDLATWSTADWRS